MKRQVLANEILSITPNHLGEHYAITIRHACYKALLTTEIVELPKGLFMHSSSTLDRHVPIVNRGLSISPSPLAPLQ
jgi:hypothetical protein